MSLTKIGSIGINTGIAFAGVTTIVTLNTANDALSIGATVNVGSGITLGASGDIFATGVSTVTTLKVGSGVTVSSDGDIFATGVCTATSFSGSGANLTGIDTDLVSDTSPQLGGNLDVNTKNIVFGDSGGATDDRLTFGAGTDLSIYHDGSNSYLQDSGTGDLLISGDSVSIVNAAASEFKAKFISNGAVELYYDNSKIFETGSDQATITGKLTINRSSNDEKLILSGSASPYIRFQESTTNKAYMQWSSNGYIEIYNSETSKGMRIGGQGVEVLDDIKLAAGNSQDLQIYHSSGVDKIESNGGGLHIRQINNGDVHIHAGADSSASNNRIVGRSAGAAELYHSGTKKFETHDVGTIFTEAGSGETQAAIKVNTTLDTYGSVTVRDRRDVNVAVAAFQVENASNGSNETNLLLRSVNLNTTAFAHGIYSAKSHRFAVSSNTTPKVQIDSDGIKFNNDQAADNALYDYEEGIHNPTDASGSSLTFSYPNSGRYTKIGRAVIVSFDVIFPSTSNTGLAAVTTPFSNGLNYGAGTAGWTDLGRPVQVHVSTTNVYLMDNNSGSGNQKHLTNAECSGKRFIINYTLQLNE